MLTWLRTIAGQWLGAGCMGSRAASAQRKASSGVVGTGWVMLGHQFPGQQGHMRAPSWAPAEGQRPCGSLWTRAAKDQWARLHQVPLKAAQFRTKLSCDPVCWPVWPPPEPRPPKIGSPCREGLGEAAICTCSRPLTPPPCPLLLSVTGGREFSEASSILPPS